MLDSIDWESVSARSLGSLSSISKPQVDEGAVSEPLSADSELESNDGVGQLVLVAKAVKLLETSLVESLAASSTNLYS